MDDPKELLAQFENLGDNCEFGIAQRHAGIEPLGLFRFTGTGHLPSIVEAIDNRLEDFGIPEDVELFGGPGEWIGVHIKRYHVIYATATKRGNADESLVFDQEITKMRFLKRKFLEDLEEGHKIFVRKGGSPNDLEGIRSLGRAISRHGPGTLLWVVEATPSLPNGSIETVETGILKGAIEKFAPASNVPSLSLENWLQLCRNAYKIRDRTRSSIPSGSGSALAKPS
jgi:hypothetical protein